MFLDGGMSGSMSSPASVRLTVNPDGSQATAYKQTIIRIPSTTPSWSIDAWKYNPTKTKSPCPVIVMAHGFSGTKSMGLSTYAKTFASLGYACVVFDYRRWGASDGMPRHSVFVSEQLEDYRTVIKFCRQQSDFDPQRVILWGTSFSGGHVVALADERNLNVRLVISQCPYLGSLVKHPFNIGALKTYGYAILDLLKQALGLSPVYIPVTAEPGQVGILTSPGTVSGMSHLAASEDIYPNEISASSLFEVPFYKPSVNAKKIDCPLLLVVPKYDNICDIREAASITRDVPNSELVKLDGGHFDVYPGGSIHDASLAAQVTFLHKYVPV